MTNALPYWSRFQQINISCFQRRKEGRQGGGGLSPQAAAYENVEYQLGNFWCFGWAGGGGVVVYGGGGSQQEVISFDWPNLMFWDN